MKNIFFYCAQELKPVVGAGLGAGIGAVLGGSLGVAGKVAGVLVAVNGGWVLAPIEQH